MRQRSAVQLPRFEGDTLKLVETHHGYGVRAKRGPGVLMALEWALRGVGAALVLAGLLLWILPDAWALSGNLSLLVVASAILILAGAMLSWKASHGLSWELQVIPRERRVELATRNSLGRQRTVRSFALRDLESFYVKRSKDPFEPAGLYLRLRGAQEMRVARGTAVELRALHAILCADLQPPKARQLPRRPRRTQAERPMVA